MKHRCLHMGGGDKQSQALQFGHVFIDTFLVLQSWCVQTLVVPAACKLTFWERHYGDVGCSRLYANNEFHAALFGVHCGVLDPERVLWDLP